jgi:arylformamidase
MAGLLKNSLAFVRMPRASSLFDRGYAIQFQIAGVKELRPVTVAGLHIERNFPYHPEAAADSSFQSLDIYVKSAAASNSDRSVLIFLHGGGWRGSDKDDPLGVHANVCKALAQRDIVAVNVNYRLSPQAKHPAFAQDAAHALRWVRERIRGYHGDPEQIFVSGHSAGAHLAALIALDPTYLRDVDLQTNAIKGVVGISGIYNITHFAKRNWMAEYLMTRPAFGPDPPVRTAASPLSHVTEGAPPFLLLNAQEDAGLEEEAEELATALRSKGSLAETAVLPGTNHFSILSFVGNGNDAVVQHIERFVKKHSSRCGG